ncbi:ribosomal protein L7/L12 [Ornithinicoccus hortensis]|uniref:Ribosomal L7/L12-like protein n=1 Tax=Ornithinicoccus hortensis TaxID=82346 RepID=A0A542YSM2_9MICO|nr:ribosomal protein L7/L12 [Ornithinicoccus hortensis]TQL50944.1 ribosomal L7/L12-like protein [Ornithinicoccus hortensis]
MGLFSNDDETAALRRRVAILERQVAALAQHVGLDQLPDQPGVPHGADEVVQLLRQDKKIAAVKAYREATGEGLAEAKRAVEDIERSLR